MKNTRILNLLFLILFMSYNTTGFSQDLDASVRLTDVTNTDSLVIANYVITLPFSQGVSELEYKLGVNSDYSLVDTSVVFTAIPVATSNIPMYRIGNKIFIQTGELPRYPNYFGYVRWKSINGIWSDPFEFIFN